MNCPICNKEFNISGIGRHFKTKHNLSYSEYAKENGLKLISPSKQLREVIYDNNSINICEYGCNGIGKYKLKNNKWCCSNNVSSCKGMKQKNSNSLKNKNTNWKNGKHPMSGRKAWNHGLTKELDNRIKTNPEKISNSLKGNKIFKNLPLEKQLEFKEKRRQEMLNRYKNGFEVKCGRAPKYDYESAIAGKIKVDGSWELKVAKYLDSLNIKWIRNKERFEYINELNKMSTYCPDFYVYDWDCYIEVKGYKTKKDELKWEQFTKNLQIWNKQKLQELKILEE